MTDTTPRIGAPLLAAAQAQKHVTHNEALYQFDAFLCARFIDRTLTAPPSSPSNGDTYLVATGGTGTWLGQDGAIAYCADGSWRFYPPFAGLTAYVSSESKLIVWSGSAWVDFASTLAMQNLPMVGVNTTADSTNKLSVQSNAVLFADLATGSGGTGDIRATLSKQASGNTASFLFQDAFSGRAEVGLTGDNNFHFKVSPDGSTWHDAMDIAASTGSVSIANADINGGTVDGAAIGSATPSSGAFTTLSASAAATLSPANANVTLSPTGTGKVVINPATAGSIDNATVGKTTPATGAFTQALVGPSFASVAVGSQSADLQVAATSASASLSILRATASSAQPYLTLGKSRATAIGSFAAVQASDLLGRICFAGDDGTSYGTVAADIRATVNGAVGTGNVPANLGLYVMTGGALTEMLHIPTTGDMTFATSGGVQAHVSDTASAADYVTLTGSAAGSPGVVSMGAGGSDTNIDIALSPKGSGAVRMNTVSNGSVATALSSIGPTGAHTTVQEWFAVKNASGVIRYIPAF